jgi:putative endonuclease
VRRIYEHKQKLVEGFSEKYDIDKLVHAEQFNDIHEAICREKCIKKWKRVWKLRLIEEHNPEWEDLYENIL